MEQNENNNREFTDKILQFCNFHKKKIYVTAGILILTVFSLTLLQMKNENENILVAEKYVKAGLLFISENKEESKKIYEEIIYSKNSFYGILALNAIIEKSLFSNKIEVLNFFEILKTAKQSKEQLDIINFKKGLFLIKNSDPEAGKELLNSLIKNESKLKFLAEEIIIK
jgi:hypothetical protein